MDPTIKSVLEGSFAQQANAMGQITTLIAGNNQFVDQQSQLQYLTHNALINSTAAQVLMGNKLAQDILAQNSARDQPGFNLVAAKP